MTGTASASSFVTPDPMTTKHQPAPAGAADFVRISPSVIAPAVSFEHVSAANKDESNEEAEGRGLFGSIPTVIRGGVVDNGGSTEVSAPAEPAKKPETRNRAPAVAESGPAPSQAAPSSSETTSSPPPPKQADVPIPSPTPAPPPPNIIPQAKIQ